jgi:hypothetical protein
MHVVYFHPQIQNSSLIIPIDSAVGSVWSMNTGRGKKFFCSPYHCFGAMEITQLLVKGTGVLFRKNDRKPDYPTPSSAWLRMGTSVPPIPLITYISFYGMVFNIDYDDDCYGTR